MPIALVVVNVGREVGSLVFVVDGGGPFSLPGKKTMGKKFGTNRPAGTFLPGGVGFGGLGGRGAVGSNREGTLNFGNGSQVGWCSFSSAGFRPGQL